MGKYGSGLPGVHETGPVVSENGFRVGDKDSSVVNIDSSGNLYQAGVMLTDTAATLNKTKSFSETIEFETIGAAGVYTGDISLPAGALIENIIITAIALCNAGTSALMDVGDFSDATTAIDANGFFSAINLKATDLLADESIDFYRTGGKEGAYLPYTTDGQNAASHITNRYYADARIIRGVVTTVGTDSTTGKTLMTVVYSVPEPVSATFVESE